MSDKTPATTDLALQQTQMSAYNQETTRLERHGQWISKTLMYFRAVVRVLNFLASIGVAATAGNCLVQFYHTRNATSSTGQRLWSPTSMLWPTIFALATAVIVLFLSGIVVFAYFCGIKAADKWDTWKGYYSTFATVIHTAFSTAVTSSLFVTSSNPKSLNNQSCSPSADAKQPFFPQINLSNFCLKQNFMQYTTAVQIGMGVLTVLTYLGDMIDKRHKRKVDKHNAMAPKTDTEAAEAAPQEKGEATVESTK